MPDAKFASGSVSIFGDMTSQIFSLKKGQVIEFGYLPPENGFNFLKNEFYVQNRFSQPKVGLPCQFQQFIRQMEIFHFQNFLDVLMTKEQQQPP